MIDNTCSVWLQSQQTQKKFNVVTTLNLGANPKFKGLPRELHVNFVNAAASMSKKWR